MQLKFHKSRAGLVMVWIHSPVELELSESHGVTILTQRLLAAACAVMSSRGSQKGPTREERLYSQTYRMSFTHSRVFHLHRCVAHVACPELGSLWCPVRHDRPETHRPARGSHEATQRVWHSLTTVSEEEDFFEAARVEWQVGMPMGMQPTLVQLRFRRTSP